MMIEDYSVFRDIPFRDVFHIDPYYQGFSERGRVNLPRSSAVRGSDTFTGRRSSSREFVIPIQVEGRDFPTASQHSDLTNDIGDENVNNSGLHSRSRNRRRHLFDSRPSNSEAGKCLLQSGVSSCPVSRGRQNALSEASRDGQTAAQLSDDIIDLCMYEDMGDSSDMSDGYISESCVDNSLSTLTCSKSKTGPCSVKTKSDSKLSEPTKQSKQQEITPTPSYPVYRYLKSQLARDGRLIDYIQGDGNCFFRALSKEIYGSEEFHGDVRQAVVDLIEKYPKEFEQFLDSGMSVFHHIKEMRKSSTWASSAEIYAAATLVQRDVYVLSPDHTGEAYHWMLFKPRFMYTRDTSYHPCFITLCHTHGNHYDRITPQQGKCNCDYEPPVLSGVHAYVDLTN